MAGLSRADCEALDRADPLAPWRDRFELPPGSIYLDGNSLGALPKATADVIAATVRQEWGADLITSWNRHGWVDLPVRVGATLAGCLGAAPHEVVITDSISVNLFKLAAAALGVRPGRRTILVEAGIFPTDGYVLQGLAGLLGERVELRPVPVAEMAAALNADTALMVLTQVDYRTGALRDMAGLTDAAHAAGALALWDLAHSAGAVPVDLGAAGTDMAVGCGYKYLNGGPGAPAFLYVAERLQAEAVQPLSGWFGHARPFDFGADYVPAEGLRRFLCGTPPILSMRALQVGVELFAEVDQAALRDKSMALTQRFIELVDQECAGLGLELVTPRDPARRGSQVAYRHPEGYAIVQALIAAGVVGDFRAPDLVRFGFAPLYLRYVDAFDAAVALREVLSGRVYDQPAFRRRAAVT